MRLSPVFHPDLPLRGLPCLVVMPPPSSTTSVHGPLGLSDPGPRTTELRQRLSGSDGERGASISRRSLYRPLRCSTWCSTLVVYSGALPLVVSSLTTVIVQDE
ncbi:hypothetical protein PRIPAC_74296, partial [Pristionchus pacificus]|uniref:Uncharacterized protein n=1 Tax=Pristionchus pacificus TaxID=54126 RepID=A0A2A6CFX8_PRIPA